MAVVGGWNLGNVFYPLGVLPTVPSLKGLVACDFETKGHGNLGARPKGD